MRSSTSIVPVQQFWEKKLDILTNALTMHDEMKKLKKGDYSGPTLDRSRYLVLRNTAIAGNPRQTEEYRDKCCCQEPSSGRVAAGASLQDVRHRRIKGEDAHELQCLAVFVPMFNCVGTPDQLLLESHVRRLPPKKNNFNHVTH